MVKIQRVMILVESEGVTEEFMVQLARVVKMPKQMRNTVTIVAALNISSIIACLWKPLETRNR